MPPKTSRLSEFVQAVRALSYDPAATNVERYLAASRAIGEAPSRRKTGPARRAVRAS